MLQDNIVAGVDSLLPEDGMIDINVNVNEDTQNLIDALNMLTEDTTLDPAITVPPERQFLGVSEQATRSAVGSAVSGAIDAQSGEDIGRAFVRTVGTDLVNNLLQPSVDNLINRFFELPDAGVTANTIAVNTLTATQTTLAGALATLTTAVGANTVALGSSTAVEGISTGIVLEGMQNGGSFNVGGVGGIDSQLVAFRASPNERVTVERPEQIGNNTQAININNVFDSSDIISSFNSRAGSRTINNLISQNRSQIRSILGIR